MNAIDRFFDKVDKQDCWLWTAYLDKHGYGQFRDSESRKVYAHRFAHEYFNGPIASGMVIDHKCKTRHCVNPSHLRVVSVQENVLVNSNSCQAANAIKTSCVHGHMFDAVNTGTDKRGDRYCKQCARDRSRVRYASS